MAQISQTNFRRRLTLSLALPLLLMGILAASLLRQVNQLTSVVEWVAHSDRVIAQVNHTEKLIIDMETGLRGYLVTGNTEFLEPYQKASLAIASAFDQLGRSVSDNSTQVQQLAILQTEYQQWQRYAQQMITLRKQRRDYQAYGINAQGKKQMDTIRGHMASLINTEEALRNTRTQDVQKTTRWLFVTCTSLFFGVGGILAFFIRQQLIGVAQSYGRALTIAQAQTQALRESEAAVRRSAQRLSGLHQIDRDILSAQSSEDLLHAALSRMRQLVPCQQAFVVLFNVETGTAQVVAGSGNGESQLSKGTTLPIEDFAPTEVLQQGTRYVEDLTVVESRLPIWQRLLDGNARSSLAIPLIVEQNLIGELKLAATQTAAFTPEYQEIAQEVADQLAIALHQAKLREQLQCYTAQLEQRVADRTRKLQESNAELEAFSYSVSHDLRAPLRTMQGFTQALVEDYGDKLNSIGQEYAHYIVESAVQMDTLISDLLSYSRLSRAEIQIQPLDLSIAIANALSQLETELREQQVQVMVEESLPQVMAHRTTLIQVLTNLLNNAIKFVESGIQPRVRVWAEERVSGGRGLVGGAGGVEGIGGEVFTNISQENSFPGSSQASANWLRLWVEDNGIGIAPEYHERIFRVFERLHGVETYPGTGIGLAIVYKGMERMGGRAGVESQLGQGSRFWIELPKVSG